MTKSFSLTAVGLRAAMGRPGAASIVVLGVASATIVLCVLASVVSSIQSSILTSGREDRVLVMRKGATSELESAIPARVRDVVLTLPQVARDADGAPQISEELVRVLDFRRGEGSLSFPIRGVSGGPNWVRPEVRFIEGRGFEQGRHELVLGRAVASTIPSHAVGSSIVLSGVSWQVVGIFAANGSSFESEIFTDARTLQSFYKADSMSALTVRLSDPAAFAAFKSTVEATPDIQVQVERESDFYSALSTRTGAPLRAVALLVGGLMSAAAVFLAMSASHASFSARTSQFATVRALGFQGRDVAASVLLEVGVLSIVGALLGVAIACSLCANATVSLLTGDLRMSQTAFHLRLGVVEVATAALISLLIGLLGGLPSAIRSARQPLTEALRV